MKGSVQTPKERLHEIIFEADTRAGKIFDVVLIVVIVLSVVVVMLESVEAVHVRYGSLLIRLEWIITILFTLEYFIRIYLVKRAWKYIRSFFGVIDLLSFLPTYIEFLLPGTHYFLVVRILRLLRIFRVLKMITYVGEAAVLTKSLKASRRKIYIFLFFVMNVTIIIGSTMYVVEGPEAGFTSIPRGVYWAIVTLTTVGFGDITPITPLGQFLASVVMIMGYGIIAVPTGIVTAEMSTQRVSATVSTQACQSCAAEGHDPDATYCKYCGEAL